MKQIFSFFSWIKYCVCWLETYPGSFGTSSVSPPSTAITEFSIFREFSSSNNKIGSRNQKSPKIFSRPSISCPKSRPTVLVTQRSGDFLLSSTESVSFHFSVSLYLVVSLHPLASMNDSLSLLSLLLLPRGILAFLLTHL